MSEQDRVGVFATDTRLVVTAWDAWLERCSGIAASQARGRSLKELIPDLSERGLLHAFERVLEKGVVEVLAPALHGRLIRCASAGSEMLQRVVIAPLRIGDRVAGVLVTIEDVTGRIEHERELKRRLEGGGEQERLRAVEELSALGREEDSTLFKALGDASWRVRRTAVQSVAAAGGPAAVEELVRALREEQQDVGVINSALQVLAMMNLDVVGPLAKCLKDGDSNVRLYAALALGNHGDDRAVPFLMDSLSDSDGNVRFHVIEALGKLGAREAAEPLAAIACGGDEFLAFPALEALERCGGPSVAPQLRPLLSNETLRGAAARALGALGDDSMVEAISTLLSDAGAVRDAAAALVRIEQRFEKLYGGVDAFAERVRAAAPDESAARLGAALETAKGEEARRLTRVLGWLPDQESRLAALLSREDTRGEAVRALVTRGHRAAGALLERLSRQEDPQALLADIDALGQIGARQAVPRLMEFLVGDAAVVVAAVGALARIGDHRAFEPILTLLDHPDGATRQAAVGALNSLGHPQLESRATALLSHSSPRVRQAAVRIAGYFGWPSAFQEVLRLSQEDAEPSVRRAAVEVLPYFEDERSFAALDAAAASSDPAARAAAAKSLAHCAAAAAAPRLRRLLDDPEEWVRFFAARAAGASGSAVLCEDLAGVAENDRAIPVKAAAAEALGVLGGACAARTLARLSRAAEADVFRPALAALGRLDGDEAAAALRDALWSPDPSKRLEAARSVVRGGAGLEEALAAVSALGDAAAAREAIAALGRVGSEEAVKRLLELAGKTPMRDDCIDALAFAGRTALPALVAALKGDGDRLAVVDALRRLRIGEATAALAAALEDQDDQLRAAAAAALGELGSMAVRDKLLELSRSDPSELVRRAAHWGAA